MSNPLTIECILTRDCIGYIGTFLDIPTLYNVSLTCKKLYNYLNLTTTVHNNAYKMLESKINR